MKQVSQATFDAIVREAINDFDLTPEEAVLDAKEQLTKAGVTDFSNIQTTATPDAHNSHPGVSLPEKLQAAIDDQNRDHTIAFADELTKAIENDRQTAAIAGAHEAVSMASQVLVHALLASSDDSLRAMAASGCRLVASLCDGNEINRSKFITDTQYDGINALIMLLQLLNSQLEDQQLDWTSKDDCEMIFITLNAIAAVQRRSEKVKTRFTAAGFLNHLLRILDETVMQISDNAPTEPERVAVVANIAAKICILIRQVLAPDDTTTAVSDSFNRARLLTGSKVITESGIKPLTYPKTFPEIVYRILTFGQASSLPTRLLVPLLVESLRGVRLCAIADEICSDLMDHGFHTLTFDLLVEYSRDNALVRAALALLANLANRDQCKSQLFAKFDVIMQVSELHMATSPQCAEQYATLLARLCLRRPDHARSATTCGYVDALVDAMKVHSKAVGVLKMGCLAIRNVCARDAAAREYVRSKTSSEAVIRAAWADVKLIDLEAYSALSEMDVLMEDEMRRDNRYTMPAGFNQMKLHRR